MSSWDALSRVAEPATRDAQLNISNLKTMGAEPPDRFAYIRFDPNNNCNVHCVYCHNERSQGLVPTEEFRAVLEQNVISVENFQAGCGMEPTLDKRLADLLLLAARSPAKPRHDFVLQTNGILLHFTIPGRFASRASQASRSRSTLRIPRSTVPCGGDLVPMIPIAPHRRG